MASHFARPSWRVPGVIVVLGAVTSVLSAQTSGVPAKFTANALNLNRGAAGQIEIVVDRWSSDAQRDRLMKVLREKGPDKLLDVVQELPRMGNFRAPGNLGIDIRFARRLPGADGGERVILVTDRPIGFLEATNRPRSVDYPFTVIELRLNADGTGEGKMSLATRITEDTGQNVLTLENYELQPVLLTEVRRERRT